MPPNELIRSLPLVDHHVSGRIVEGQALAWDKPYEVTDDGRHFYREGFRRGAFIDSIRDRGNWFELRTEHADIRVGRVEFREAPAGLMFTATVDNGVLGDAELELLRAGERNGVSIRYKPVANEGHAPPWWRKRVDVRELSLTSRPQYGADAKVLVMRSRPSQTDKELAALLDWKAPVL